MNDKIRIRIVYWCNAKMTISQQGPWASSGNGANFSSNFGVSAYGRRNSISISFALGHCNILALGKDFCVHMRKLQILTMCIYVNNHNRWGEFFAYVCGNSKFQQCAYMCTIEIDGRSSSACVFRNSASDQCVHRCTIKIEARRVFLPTYVETPILTIMRICAQL